jgi:protein-L-isoaspartate(D-aspartate) O-methyltransferase
VTEASGEAGPQDLAQLRDKAVDRLIEEGTVTSEAVEAATRTVPRHLFIPEASPEEAYDPFRAFVTKRDAEGNALSSVSDMHVQSWMLEHAGIKPGMNVLEVGSGGYNAALLAELVGPAGNVTTVDIDEWVTDRTSRFLGQAGYGRVNVVLADAEHGVPGHAPYDAVLVTAGCWDVPPAWSGQLAAHGRLVTALRFLGLQRVIAFEKADGHLASTDSRQFGFVPVQGEGAHQARLLVMRGGEITLRYDDDYPADPQLLQGVFSTPRTEAWSGVTIGPHELLDTVQVWLGTVLPGFCALLVDQARDTGIVTPPHKRSFALATVDGATLAYVTDRPAEQDGEKASEFGVHAYGPDAGQLASQVAGYLQAWATGIRHGARPHYRLYPAGTPDDALNLPGGTSRVIDKARSRLTISWPQTAEAEAGQATPAITAPE